MAVGRGVKVQGAASAGSPRGQGAAQWGNPGTGDKERIGMRVDDDDNATEDKDRAREIRTTLDANDQGRTKVVNGVARERGGNVKE